VVLARPADAALRARVSDLLGRLKADPTNGIADIITGVAIAKAGGNPDAVFYLNLADGWMAQPWRGPMLPVVVDPAPYKGMHGYFPEDLRMRSTFLLLGPGIAKRHDLGTLDMRAIAPTLAAILGVTLARAELPPIGVAPSR